VGGTNGTDLDNKPLRRAPWNAPKEEAAMLMAVGALTIPEIMQRVEMREKAFTVLRASPDFKERVQHYKDALRKGLAEIGIAEKNNRLQALDDRWKKMKQIIEDREKEFSGVSQARTGLMKKMVRLIPIGGGEVQEVASFAVDDDLLKEMREVEKQAAIEAEQWHPSDSAQHTGPTVVLLPWAPQALPPARPIDASRRLAGPTIIEGKAN
jgi:hypothetical protein